MEAAFLTNSDGYDVATLMRVIDVSPTHQTLNDEQWQQMINLIDAVPDLLAACETVVNDCDAILDGDDMSGMSDEELFSAIKQTLTAAIAKAKGGAK